MKNYRKPHTYKKKRPVYRNRFFRLGILVFILMISTFYFLFFFRLFQIDKIIISGESKVSADSLRSSIENELSKKILFFETKSIFSVDLNEMKKDILNEFPQVAEIEIHRALPDSLEVLVIERFGVANFCVAEKCFLLDNEGIVFEETSLEYSTSSLLIIDEQNLITPAFGEKVMEKERLSRILETESQLKSESLKIQIKEFLILPEDKLSVMADGNWEIYFNLAGDIPWQITKLRAVLEEKIPPEKRKDLEYIELRFGNFAPFKYKD